MRPVVNVLGQELRREGRQGVKVRAEPARRERRRGLVRHDVRLLETRGEVPRRPGAKSRSASNWLRRRERAWEHVLEERYDEETVADVRRELRGLIRVVVIEQELREGPTLRRVLGDQTRSH